MRGDIQNRAIQGFVVDLDMVDSGQLQLQALEHDAIQHLRAQGFGSGQGRVLCAQLLFDGVEFFVQLRRGDDVVVDYRDDSVDGLGDFVGIRIRTVRHHAQYTKQRSKHRAQISNPRFHVPVSPIKL